MAKVLRCRDVGMECDYTAHGETEEEIMQQAAEHVRTVHGMEEAPPEVVEKVRAAIHEEH
jgi:predicted small metal-binding protein